MRLPCLLLILATTACQSLPKDPWLRAVKEVDRGELLGAIRDLDLLPPTHPRYGEARILAQAVERRLRTSQDLVQRGLRLRAQWRDEEALRQFELAQEVWPQVQGARDLEKATLNRIHAMDPQSEDQWGELGVEPDPEIMPAAPNGETSALPAKPVDPLLVELELAGNLVVDGDLDAAISLLSELAEEFAGRREPKRQLARALHQRALLRYGQGYLEEALADWSRVSDLEPKFPAAEAFASAARAELKLRNNRS